MPLASLGAFSGVPVTCRATDMPALGYNSHVATLARTAPEIEIKLRVADIPALIRKLRRLGATTRGRVFERNTLYDTHESDFRRRGLLFRVRMETPAAAHSLAAGARRAVLTFKAPPDRRASRARNQRYKERLETELEIQRPATLGANASRAWPSSGFPLRKIPVRIPAGQASSGPG